MFGVRLLSKVAKPSPATMEYVVGSTATALTQMGVNYLANRNNIKPELHHSELHPSSHTPLFKKSDFEVTKSRLMRHDMSHFTLGNRS